MFLLTSNGTFFRVKKTNTTKNIKSPVIGEVDIFLVPNLEAGNMLAKQLALIANAVSAGIILGASVPIILTSRADGVRSRVGSCAIAVMLAHAKRVTDLKINSQPK